MRLRDVCPYLPPSGRLASVSRQFTMTSPSGELQVVLIGRSRFRFRWQVWIRDRLIEQGYGSDGLVDTMRTASTRGDLYGEATVLELRSILNRLESE